MSLLGHTGVWMALRTGYCTAETPARNSLHPTTMRIKPEEAQRGDGKHPI